MFQFHVPHQITSYEAGLMGFDLGKFMISPTDDIYESQEILASVIRAISSSADADIEVAHHKGELEFTVRIPRSEAGRVIGRYGDVIKSIRSIMYGITMHQYRKRSNVVVEPY